MTISTKVVTEELVNAGRTVVVVERSADCEAELSQTGFDFIASETRDETLELAGAAHAEAMVVATSNGA